jgi:N-acetyl-gamma-glutamyl-phosphate reductase
MSALKAGVIGGAGYTAGELLRILLNHPQVEVSFVHSNSHAGHKLYEAHNDLLGETELAFTDKLDTNVDVLFLCLGHGKAVEFLDKNNVPKNVRIIDLSQDFRLKSNYTSPYGVEREFVYGLPELRRDEIRKAHNIANPGCFAAAFELALLPLAAAKLINGEVHVNGITGSSGAGQALSDTTHFSWRNNNVSIYKAFNHQHLKEVRLTLETAGGGAIPELNFIPMRGNFSRGILLSAYTQSNLDACEAVALYEKFYKDAAFTFVSDHEISVKEVVNTNKCIVQVEKYDDKVLITSAIDNLTKGASGQAVQNMNLMFGFDEKAGLRLKSVGF